MNTFNRMVVILILLGTIAGSALAVFVLLFASPFLATIFANLGATLNSPKALELRVELMVIALIFFVPSVVLLLFEVRRSEGNSIRISQVTGSDARLSTGAVLQSLRYYVDALPGVVRVKPQVMTRAKMIDVRLDVETTPDIDVRAKTEEIARTARGVVGEKLGLQLNRLSIHIHQTQYPRRKPASTEGATAPAPRPQPAPAKEPVVAASGPADVNTSPVENKNPLT
ncbi:MAG: hypothetical protein HY259_04725 [Chloroflexi bacterium]|nr:hypothetical protein [Chloroflexota bacterium]MBI3732747.1 hypothetical protein [Chloroflexota bacterium]